MGATAGGDVSDSCAGGRLLEEETELEARAAGGRRGQA